MTSPYKQFGTDKDLESGKGVTLQYDGFSITIHRAGGSNKKFGLVLAEKMKPHRQRYERGTLDNETADKILIETYAESVIVGWKDVVDSEGKQMTFNKENIVKLLTDLPDLFNDIKTQANLAAVFLQENEAIEAKN